MTQEEKAKRYDEAIKRIENIKTGKCEITFMFTEDLFEYIFPELAESEDERIRKAIFGMVYDSDNELWSSYDVSKSDVLAWLEKQGKETSWKPSKDEIDALYGLAYITDKMDDKKDEAITKLYQDLKREIFSGVSYENMFPSSPVDAPIKLVEQKPIPKFKIGDTMRTLQEAKDGWTDGMPFIVSIDSEHYNCNSEKIAIKDQDEYEYPPMNRKHDVCDTCDEKASCVNPCPTKLIEEQKPTNKIKPKFKVGDWIIGRATSNEPRQISEITDQSYKSTYGGQYGFSFEDEMHLWTIQDAKDGDVLAYNDGHGNDCIELIKSITGKKIEFWFCLTNGNSYEVFDGIIPYTNLVSREDATPATKEQRNLLFQKMKEAGYEWDAEKKELKKVEQKPAWSEEDEKLLKFIEEAIISVWKGITQDTLLHWLKSLKGRVQPQSKWSEEDEMRFNNIFTLLEGLPLSQNWLKSLKERVQLQQRQEWSEGDKRIIDNLISQLGNLYARKLIKEETKDKYVNWLKSLRPKSQWKPSEEQISVLSRSLKYINTISKNYCHVLGELLAQLKKLREE